MIGLGTIVNTAGIALGGAVGFFFGRFFKERLRETLNMACGVSVLCIGVAGTMEGMLSIAGGSIGSGRSMYVTDCLGLGGVFGDPSVLITKSVLDLIIVLTMTCSMGIGCAFSAVPVAMLEGLMTFAARLLKPLMTEAALANLSLIGSILIFCVGVNLVFGKRTRVANLLPGLVIAVGAAFIPS